MTLKVPVARRRARLMTRHFLAAPAASVTDAAEAMIALHATDPVTVYLSAHARTGCARGASLGPSDCGAPCGCCQPRTCL